MNQLRKKSVRFLLLTLFFSFFNFPAYAEEVFLIPMGQTIGVTLDMKGVTIVDTTDVEDYENNRHTPAKDAGLRSGDRIESIDGMEIASAKQLEEVVNNRGENVINIVFRRNGKTDSCKVKPELSNKDGHYRIGVWIKDAASGIGTITYCNPETGAFGALGHGISDATEEVLSITGGDLWKANVVSVQKGGKGNPGELIAVFSEGKGKIGDVQSNSTVGLKGTIEKEEVRMISTSPIPVAKREEVTEGTAEIWANVEEEKVEKFSVEIQKINKDTESTKGMIIKITDERLLSKTGGIVQGMSGSPILQNGRIVGAVTHVFVNDPTRGYGIFIENMLAEAEKQ